MVASLHHVDASCLAQLCSVSSDRNAASQGRRVVSDVVSCTSKRKAEAYVPSTENLNYDSGSGQTSSSPPSATRVPRFHTKMLVAGAVLRGVFSLFRHAPSPC